MHETMRGRVGQEGGGEVKGGLVWGGVTEGSQIQCCCVIIKSEQKCSQRKYEAKCTKTINATTKGHHPKWSLLLLLPFFFLNRHEKVVHSQNKTK